MKGVKDWLIFCYIARNVKMFTLLKKSPPRELKSLLLKKRLKLGLQQNYVKDALKSFKRKNFKEKGFDTMYNYKYDSAYTMDLLEIARKTVKEAEANAEKNPTSDKIQVVVVEPNKKPFKLIIDNELEAFQKIVCGYIENVFIGETETGARIGLVLNEEGKLQGLPFNRKIVGLDVLVGTFFITAYNLQGDNISLTDKEANYFIKRFQGIEVYL